MHVLSFTTVFPRISPMNLRELQKRARRIIFLFCSYNEFLVESSLTKLSDRRQELVVKLFKEIVQNKENKLDGLLPCLALGGKFPQKKLRILFVFKIIL